MGDHNMTPEDLAAETRLDFICRSIRPLVGPNFDTLVPMLPGRRENTFGQLAVRISWLMDEAAIAQREQDNADTKERAVWLADQLRSGDYTVEQAIAWLTGKLSG